MKEFPYHKFQDGNTVTRTGSCATYGTRQAGKNHGVRPRDPRQTAGLPLDTKSRAVLSALPSLDRAPRSPSGTTLSCRAGEWSLPLGGTELPGGVFLARPPATLSRLSARLSEIREDSRTPGQEHDGTAEKIRRDELRENQTVEAKEKIGNDIVELDCALWEREGRAPAPSHFVPTYQYGSENKRFRGLVILNI